MLKIYFIKKNKNENCPDSLNYYTTNSFVKIINIKVSSKPCQISEMKLFPQVDTGLRGELRILLNI